MEHFEENWVKLVKLPGEATYSAHELNLTASQFGHITK